MTAVQGREWKPGDGYPLPPADESASPADAERLSVAYQPRTIYVKVSTALLAEFGEWSEPVRVKIEAQPDDTHEMIFRDGKAT